MFAQSIINDGMNYPLSVTDKYYLPFKSMTEFRLKRPLEKTCLIDGCENKRRTYDSFKSKFCCEHACSYANYTNIKCVNMHRSDTIKTCPKHTCKYEGCENEAAYLDYYIDSFCKDHILEDPSHPSYKEVESRNIYGHRTRDSDDIPLILLIFGVPVMLIAAIVIALSVSIYAQITGVTINAVYAQIAGVIYAIIPFAISLLILSLPFVLIKLRINIIIVFVIALLIISLPLLSFVLINDIISLLISTNKLIQ